jgi:hypothetical protein
MRSPWALKSINFLLHNELGKFPLGVVVRRNPEQATPTFAMTDFLFHVHGNPEKKQASTLAYLGVFSGRPLPTNKDDARRKLTDNWVPPPRLDGTVASVSGIMALRKGAFLDNHLIPHFAEVLGRQPDPPDPKYPSAPVWRFSGKDDKTQTQDDIIHRVFQFDTTWHVILNTQPVQDRLLLQGRIESRCNYDGFVFGPAGDKASEWFRYRGHRDIDGSVKLTGVDQGIRYKLESRLQFTIGDLVVDEDNHGGWHVVSEGLSKGLKGLGIIGQTPNEILSGATRELIENLRRWLNDGLNRITVDLTNHAFIPPGGGVFLFGSPRFTPEGDLHLDVTYRAP